VVNAVSLYVERGNTTFRSVHVEAAARVAREARRALGLKHAQSYANKEAI